ncbi:ABC transporter substrate-binding protein [Treponema primitia]|nr:ABC transporter substrate-binding protein [Treponema primitia]
MRRKGFLGALLIALAATALFIGCSKKEQTIKIGFNIPLTGDNPMVGEGSKNAGDIVLKALKAQGGLTVKGQKYPVEFIYVDNELKAESAVQAALRLIEQDKVLAVVGPQGSGRAIPAGQVNNDNRTPMISAWSTNPDTTLNRPYVFRACFLDPFQAPVAAKFAKEQFNVTKTAILYNLEDDYSKTLAELYRDSWQAANGPGSVVVFDSFGQRDQDFSAQLTRIVNSGAEMLYLPVYYNFVALIVPQAKDLGWNKPIMGADAWGSADLVPLSKGSVAGYYFTTHYAAAGAVGKTKEFIDEYNASYGYIPDDVAALTYDAVNIVLQAIQNAGLSGDLQKDRNAIKDAMAALRNYDGITGKMNFNVQGDPEKDAVVVRISEAGEFVYVTSLQP